MSGGGRAGRTAQNPDRYGYHEHTERVDAVMDAYSRLRDQLSMAETELALVKNDLTVAERGSSTGAVALTRILALCHGRNYVSVADVKNAIFGHPTYDRVGP